MPDPKQPWKPSFATQQINRIAKTKTCDFAYTLHVRERMDERDLLMSDVLFVLKQGFVYVDPEPSTIEGLYKYKIESQSPNSGSRSLRVVAIPDNASCQIKVVTIMWRDE